MASDKCTALWLKATGPSEVHGRAAMVGITLLERSGSRATVLSAQRSAAAVYRPCQVRRVRSQDTLSGTDPPVMLLLEPL